MHEAEFAEGRGEGAAAAVLGGEEEAAYQVGAQETREIQIMGLAWGWGAEVGTKI